MKKNVTIFDLNEWDSLVFKTYNRIYSFQQQDDCKERGIKYFRIPIQHPEDYENDSVPEIVNGKEMGVSFKAWLARDPNQKLSGEDARFTDLWWERNFYPHVDMIIQDLYKKGLLSPGEYGIDIDW